MTVKPEQQSVKHFYALNGDAPSVPLHYAGTINSFGFPVAMKQIHKALSQGLNALPSKDINGTPTRDLFIQAITELGDANEADIQAICSQIAEGVAKQDMLEKRINQLTPADFIIDADLATANQEQVKSVRDHLLAADRKQFASVQVQPGRSTTEWDVLGAELDGPSF